MKLIYKLTIVIYISILLNFYSYAQAPAIEWQKCFGGSDSEQAFCIIKTNDNGYVVAGRTNSNDGDVIGYQGSGDCWVIKVNNLGVLEWQITMGGSNDELATNIIQTLDNGFILVGATSSNNGDVTGNNGNYDCWVVKLNSSGVIEWKKTLGGTDDDSAFSIQQTTDNGYIIAALTASDNGDVIGNTGGENAWIIKIDSIGNILWSKILKVMNSNTCSYDIQKTNNNGFIVAGVIKLPNLDTNAWIVKLNQVGDIEWQKIIGGSSNDNAKNIKQTIDNGYIVGGFTTSIDIENNGNNNGDWIIKLNSSGQTEWQTFLGGINFNNVGSSIKQSFDGNYYSCGVEFSTLESLPNNFESYNYRVVKLNSSGILQWQKNMGGSDFDVITSLELTNDNEIIAAGNSTSNDGDITSNHGSSDFWIVKLAPDNLITNTFINKTISLSPNPAKENITLKIDYFTPNQEITITDILGKVIYNQKLKSLSTTVNTGSFEKGIYFLNLIDGTQKTTKKFILE